MRKRFTAAERARFTENSLIEWRNGGHWHRGEVTSPVRSLSGVDLIEVTHLGAATRTVARFDRIDVRPGSIRED